ncbi:MAG: hypothetical protein C0614_04860 [Desulfuromonas sp.]|nr:MAG: hypothetical protein C0614_04860 [Desulfuromonas sp.]
MVDKVLGSMVCGVRQSVTLLLLMVLFVQGGWVAQAAAAEVLDEEGQAVTFQSDLLEFRKETGQVLASGSVVLQHGETHLSADRILWQNRLRDVVADGSVSLQNGAGEATGRSLSYNLTTELGLLEQGAVFLRRGNFRLGGAEIEQYGQASYRVAEGSFTTCDGLIPDWSFTAAQVDVKVGDFAVARHAWFRIRDYPVFYMPYLIFPVKTERESGLLTPRFGQSSKRGASLSLAWYQVLDRHMDATLQFDYMSRLGLGKGLEYRYLLGNNNLGSAHLYHVSGFSGEPDLHALDWEHAGSLPGGFYLSADTQHVEERLFLENFGKVAGEYNQDVTVSELWLQRSFGGVNAVLRARYIRDLAAPDADPLQRLPELNLNQSLTRLGQSPLFFGFASSLVNFDREQGGAGQRLYFRPALAAAIRVGPWLDVVPELAVSQRLYFSGQGDADRLLPELGTTLGTHLSRVYSLGVDRLRHSIEPTVRYSYVPARDEGHLPFFDGRDRIAGQNLLEYALATRLTLRQSGVDGTPQYRELLFLKLSQVYDIAVERGHRESGEKPLSSLRVELDARLAAWGQIGMDAQVGMHGDSGLERMSAAVKVNRSETDSLQFDYVYRDQTADNPKTEYLGFMVQSAVLAPLFVSLEGRYSLQPGLELEKVAAAEYRGRCWSLFVEYRHRPDDEQIMLGFELSGLGRVVF